MSTSQEFIEYITDMVAPVGHVTASRMFGGALLKVDGKQLGIILLDTLYFKVVDPMLQEAFAKEGSIQFTYTRKDKDTPVIIKNWWQVPDTYMDDEKALIERAQEVLAQVY